MIRYFVFVFLLAASACSHAEDVVRTISVSGTGTAKVEPDRATLQMSISVRAATVQEAQDEAAEVSRKVLALTDELDIDRDRVDTTGVNIRPDYRYDRNNNTQQLIGYFADRRIAIDLHDLDKLPATIEGSVDAGVNQVSPPALYSSKRRDAYREALSNAVEDARRNAEHVAKSLGAKLGPVMDVNAGGHTPSPRPQMNVRAMAMADGAAEESYNAADLTYNANISVVFELDID